MSEASEVSDLVAMRVGGVVIDPSSQVPVVILRGIEEPRLYLPIFIGGLEATAIATVLADVKMPRPMTHDLVVSVLTAVQCRIASVTVTRLDSGTFYAEVHIVDEHGGVLVLDSRPSDALALALRTDAPIAVARAVIAEAGALAPEEEEAPGAAADPGAPPNEKAVKPPADDGHGQPFGPSVDGHGQPFGPSVDGHGRPSGPSADGPRSFFAEDVKLEDLGPGDFGKYKM